MNFVCAYIFKNKKQKKNSRFPNLSKKKKEEKEKNSNEKVFGLGALGL